MKERERGQHGVFPSSTAVVNLLVSLTVALPCKSPSTFRTRERSRPFMNPLMASKIDVSRKFRRA